MTTYLLDTNAGPIVEHRARSVEEMKRWTESMIPLLDKRGYTSTWSTSTIPATRTSDKPAIRWHVVNIANSRGRHVHSAAFTTLAEWKRRTKTLRK